MFRFFLAFSEKPWNWFFFSQNKGWMETESFVSFRERKKLNDKRVCQTKFDDNLIFFFKHLVCKVDWTFVFIKILKIASSNVFCESQCGIKINQTVLRRFLRVQNFTVKFELLIPSLSVFGHHYDGRNRSEKYVTVKRSKLPQKVSKNHPH